MILGIALALVAIALLLTFFVRSGDLPVPEPVSPTAHLEVRKASIYEGLRDLGFEYRLGKLSDEDYQRTKSDLQNELAVVLAEIDRINGEFGPKVVPSKPAKSAKPARPGTVCPHCAASFPNPLKFCGECGKPMLVAGETAS